MPSNLSGKVIYLPTAGWRGRRNNGAAPGARPALPRRVLTDGWWLVAPERRPARARLTLVHCRVENEQ